MAVVNAEVKIRGTRPLLWNRFGPDALPLEKKVRSGVAGNDPDEWRRSVLATSAGQLYVERSYIFGCIRNGAKYTRRGKASLQSVVASTLDVLNDRILANRQLPKRGLAELRENDGTPVYIDVRSVTNPGTRGRNVRYRVAVAPGWEMQFRISWDNTLISLKEMESIIGDAGRFAGIGDGRNIGYGRFEVLSFQMGEENHAKKPSPKRAVASTARKRLET